MKLALSLVLVAGAALATRPLFSASAELNDSDLDLAGVSEGDLSGADTNADMEAPLIVPFDLDLDLATGLLRAGLGPEQLASGGLDANLAQKVIANAKAFFEEGGAMLEAADADYAEARVKQDTLSRLVRSGLASDEEVASLAVAKEMLAKAEVNRQEAIESLFQAATKNLEPGQVELLTAGCHNADWRLPAPYMCANREEREWVELRDALANEQICEEDGVKPDEKCQQLLAEIQAEQAIAEALTSLETFGPSVQASWDAALQE